MYFPIDQDLNETIKILDQNEFVEVAEKIDIYFTKVTPNDPYYENQWNMSKIQMESAWDTEKGNISIRIAILDVGFKLNHEDLSEKFSSSLKKDFTNINIAWYLDRGYTLINGEDYVTEDDDPTGIDSHGTEVAGLAAAKTDNSTGIAGVGWNTEIVPVRCGFVIVHPNPSIGYTGMLERDDWIKALNWVRTNNYAKVVNMSFGRNFSGGSHTDESDAINAALQQELCW